MQIRFLQASDLEDLYRIEQENFSEAEQIEQAVLNYYAYTLGQSSLAMEQEGRLVAYLLAKPVSTSFLTDDIFTDQNPLTQKEDYLAIASLSVDQNFHHQGLGTLLLAALKELAHSQGYKGISLTCKDYLISYYEMNGFEDRGPSQSQFGGQEWSDMYWECP